MAKPNNTKNSARKSAAKKAAKKAAKRTRNSKPLFADISLGKLNELLNNDSKATVTVSRNFVMDLKKAQIEAAAAADLGIE